jgi:hypothetical protein
MSLEKRGRGGSVKRNISHGNHPVCAAEVASRHLLAGAATPPNLGGEFALLLLLLLLLLFAFLMRASAQDRLARPTARPARIQQPPTIDGRLDDAAWRSAARVTDFVQQRPLDREPATEETEVYLAYDKDRLYVGIYAHYSDSGLVRANRVDRDRIWEDDRLSIIFDTFRDQQRAYRFAVNGYGVQGDTLIGNGGGLGDTSWDALFASAGQLAEDGWTAELAIPFKSLRYPARGPGEAHRWGLQIERDIISKDENVVWSPISRDVMSELGQMGLMEDVSDLSTSRNLELLPTFTAVQTRRRNEAGNFVADDVQEGGINLKYGITSNLTFDLTYNPDFSQIESDRQQIEVNQRFPISYPELRPFFLEGQEIFRIPGPIAFIHTRTIVDPQFGAKLSGKVGKMTLGVLAANDEAPGKVSDPNDPAFGKTAQFVVGRARYDLYRESTASVIFTNREFLGQFSRALGFDGEFAFGRTHRGFGRVIGTDHKDAFGVRRRGYFYDFNFRKDGRNLGYSVVTNAISPDLRTDVGFVRRVDQRTTLGNVSYRWWPGNWIVNWGPQIRHSRNYQFDRTLQDEQSGASVNFSFAKNISAIAGVNRDMERYSGINFWKTRFSFSGRVATSRRIELVGGFNTGDQIRFVTDPYLGRGTNWDAQLIVKPLSRLQTDVSINSSRLMNLQTNDEVFDIKILRVLTTYQFTNRLLIRNIIDHNTFDKTAGLNLLLTYRVNAGTVFYAGYDSRYRELTTNYLQTNRAIFMKLQYLFRYAR